MKITIAPLALISGSLLFSALTIPAQDVIVAGALPVETVVYQAPVVYQVPVVYQAPVVYQNGVTYEAPVVYAAAPLPPGGNVIYVGRSYGGCNAPVCYPSYPACNGSSSVIYFGRGESLQRGYQFQHPR